MHYKSASVEVGGETCNVNAMIKKVAEEISVLESRLDGFPETLSEAQQEQEHTIVCMIKMRCEILGSLSQQIN